MKKFNLFAMGLLAAATVSFTACSSNDDLSGAQTEQSKADGFYMTMTIKMPQSNGTRTTGTQDGEATTDESNVTSGTFFLVDKDDNVAFKKVMSKDDWKGSTIPTNNTKGETTLSISVNNVTAGDTYNVYFLANTTSNDNPWENASYTVTGGASKFSGDYSKAENFAMFNENDAERDAKKYTVTFAENNKNANDPAKVKYNNSDSDNDIKIERVTARIDEPTSDIKSISTYPTTAEKLTTEQEAKIKDALEKVSGVEMTRYAIANLSNTTYLMQHWKDGLMSIPADITYIQPTTEFGDETKANNLDFFKTVTTKHEGKDYVFENNSTDAPTTMYFEFKVNLNTDKFTNTPDCGDGTFYRYENKIYTSLQAIADAYAGQTNPFGADEVATVLKKLNLTEKEGKKVIGATEDELKKFRDDYHIEVFRAGLCYYKTNITDANQENAAMILRNTIYKVKVNNVYNIGADVPNGNPDEVKPMYYLNVAVSVNQWVQSTQGVDLK